MSWVVIGTSCSASVNSTTVVPSRSAARGRRRDDRTDLMGHAVQRTRSFRGRLPSPGSAVTYAWSLPGVAAYFTSWRHEWCVQHGPDAAVLLRAITGSYSRRERNLALIDGSPRIVTAVAPILLLRNELLNLRKLHAQLAELGFERRLLWSSRTRWRRSSAGFSAVLRRRIFIGTRNRALATRHSLGR